MKKTLLTLTCSTILAISANADMLRIEAGGGMWQPQSSGTMSYSETDYGEKGVYDSTEKTYSQGYFWMFIKHPIPILPNIRAEYVSIEDEGDVTGSFDDYTVPTGVAKADFTMKQYDIIPYYNILDNTAWITLDLGLDIKFIQADYEVKGNIYIDGIIDTSYSDSTSSTIPLGYLRLRVQAPFDIGLEGDIKYITYDGSTIMDTRVKLDYTMSFVPTLQPAIEVGYRYQSYKIDSDDDKTKMDMKFAGFYAGIMVRY